MYGDFHVNSLTYFTHVLGLRKVLLLIVSLPCFCNLFSVLYFKLTFSFSNVVIFCQKNSQTGVEARRARPVPGYGIRPDS